MVISLLVLDDCAEEEFFVENGLAYTPDGSPYHAPGSIDNILFRNVWSVPFVSSGEFIKNLRWLHKEPDILLVVNDGVRKFSYDQIQKSFPNTKIVAYTKESHQLNVNRCLKFFNEFPTVAWPYKQQHCDQLSKQLGKKVLRLHYPYDIQKYESLFPNEQKVNDVCVFAHPHVNRGRIESLKFYNELCMDGNILEGLSFSEWMSELQKTKYVINLDPEPRIGQVGIECALLGTVHIGGFSDSCFNLWEKTKGDDLRYLKFLIENINDDQYNTLLKEAKEKVKSIYSFESFRNNL